ncbi:hypothetical protein [Mycolicibacterium sp. XJ870]
MKPQIDPKPYPVNSTYYPCCRGIGGHTQDCPPARLDDAVNRVDLIRADVNKVLRELPVDAPLFAVTDVVVALNHLRQSAIALDRANDALEADVAEANR